MSCWTVPETHQPANVEATKTYLNRIAKRADGIVAISDSAKSDAVRILGIHESRIETIFPGVPQAFFDVDARTVELVREHYGLGNKYLLSVGTIEPRKNLNLLLDSYSALPQSVQEEWPLVLAGPAGWGSPDLLARLKSNSNRWRYLGYVREQHLPALTAGASLFLFPSLYEGFGLPLAQAMAAGVPSITSNVSSMPEVGGDAAVLIDPHSQAELTGAMLRLLQSPSARLDLGARARTRARQFSWDGAARKTWAYFERVCAR
jgi:alpha-1,3-rhamnosyl/mannosyltransferase